VKDFSMPEKLWELANLVTAFAVVQSLATAFALVKGELNVLRGWTAHCSMFAATSFFFVCYLIAIFWCGYVGASLDKSSEDMCAWWYATGGRAFSIFLFTAVVVVAVWGHWQDDKKRLARTEADWGKWI